MNVTEHFHWITPTIAIGDFYASTHPECWQHFSAVLNLSESQHEGMSPEYNEYLWLPFSDGDGKAFRKRLPFAMRFMKKNEGGKILVHCMAGASRSTAAVLAYLCKKEDCQTAEDLETLLKEMQKARACLYPAQVFVDFIAERHGFAPPQIGW